MNSKKILIPKQDLEIFLNQPEIPEAVKEVIRKNVEEAPYCLIREEHLRSLDNYNISRYIAELWEISYSRRHYKVGSVADKLLFNTLYEEEHEEYFRVWWDGLLGSDCKTIGDCFYAGIVNQQQSRPKRKNFWVLQVLVPYAILYLSYCSIVLVSSHRMFQVSVLFFRGISLWHKKEVYS